MPVCLSVYARGNVGAWRCVQACVRSRLHNCYHARICFLACAYMFICSRTHECAQVLYAVCVCVHVCVCVCLCMSTSIRVRAHRGAFVRKHAFMHAFAHRGACERGFAYTHSDERASTRAYLHAHALAHACMACMACTNVLRATTSAYLAYK